MSPSSLAGLQHALQAFVLHGATDVINQVRSTPTASARVRLEIYANAYRTRLTEVLESNFPMLAQRLGPDEFRTLARAYIEHHDSLQRSVRWYGDGLPAFLRTHAPYRDAPLLGDLAAWEWTMAEAFDAPDARCLQAADLSGRAPHEWGHLRFSVHPAVRRLDLAWNTPQTWKALQEGVAAPRPEKVSPPQAWLLWRKELQIYFRSLDAVEAAAIDALRTGETFGSLCAAMAVRIGEQEAPQRAAGLLHAWLESGLIRSIVSS